MTRKFFIFLGLGILLISLAFFFGKSMISSQVVWQLSGGGKLLLPLLLITALVDSINPCAFSILLLTIAFLLSIKSARSKILQIGGTYIFGLFLTYILIGLGILQTLHLFNTPHFMGKVGAVLLLLLGSINLINEFWPSFPIKLKIPRAVHGKIAELMGRITLPAALVLGMLVGLCEFPCTGGPYLTALGLLHDQTTYWQGVGYLVVYNIIFVLPLFVILMIASDKGLLEKVQSWRANNARTMGWISGFITLALGLLILWI